MSGAPNGDEIARMIDALQQPSGVYMIFGFIPDDRLSQLEAMFGDKIFVAPNPRNDGLNAVYVGDADTVALAKMVVSDIDWFAEDSITALTVEGEHRTRQNYGDKWPWESV